MTENNEGCRYCHEYVEIILHSYPHLLHHLFHSANVIRTRTLRDHSYIIQLTSAHWLTHRYLPELVDSSAMASIGTRSVTSLNLAFARVECTPEFSMALPRLEAPLVVAVVSCAWDFAKRAPWWRRSRWDRSSMERHEILIIGRRGLMRGWPIEMDGWTFEVNVFRVPLSLSFSFNRGARLKFCK